MVLKNSHVWAVNITEKGPGYKPDPFSSKKLNLLWNVYFALTAKGNIKIITTVAVIAAEATFE